MGWTQSLPPGRPLSVTLLSLLVPWAVFPRATQEVVRPSVAPPITAAAFAPAGNTVVVGSQSGIDVRSWPGLKPVRRLPTELSHVNDLAFAPGGTILAAAGGSPATHGSVELWRWPAGEHIRTITWHKDLVYAVAWRPDGNELATAGGDGSCHMIDPVSGRLRRVLEGHSRPVLALLYLPDGQTIVSAGLDETLRVWDGSGAPVRTLHNHTAGVHGLALRPGAANAESAVIASAGADRTVRLWQPASGRLIRFVRLPCSVQAVVWNRDGSRLIAAGSDGHVRLIDPDTVAVARDLPAITGWVHSVAVTPNGNDVLVGGQAGQLSRQPLN